MERLTKYSNDVIRNQAVNILRKLDSKNKLNGDELAVISAFCLIERTENRVLKEYEDLEEQSRLLKFPCTVGDRLYCIDMDEGIAHREVEIYDIDNIVIMDDDVLFKYDAHDGIICGIENIVTDKLYLDYCRVFLTQEEAETVLKELEDNL